MRKFRNKKLATVLLAFLMVFVVAGGFAALERFLHINAHVPMFAPQVAVVWQEVAATSHPTIWTTANREGVGIPSSHERFEGRTWPSIDTFHHTLTAAGVVHGTYFVSRAGDAPLISQLPSAQWYQQASAWWHLTHYDVSDQHQDHAFPDEDHISDGTLADPQHYITLNLNMVFDNFNQTYVFDMTIGNPGDIDLEIIGVNIVEEPDALTAAGAIVQVDWDVFEGILVEAGDTETVELTFSAPESYWMAFFEEDEGIEFLDDHFTIPCVEGNWVIELVASIPTT